MNRLVTAEAYVCPFCPLHCDDVSVVVEELEKSFSQIGCEKAVSGFVRSLDSLAKPRIEDREVSYNEVLHFVSQRWAGSECISVVTNGNDLETSRVLERFRSANRIKLFIDEDCSATAWRSAVSREGIVSATLADARLHADVVWMIGDVVGEMPRIKETIKTDGKSVIETVSLNADLLVEWTQQIRSLRLDQIESSSDAKRLSDAAYLCILIGPDAFVRGQEVATAELLAKLVWFLNNESRCVAISLDSAATNRSVSAWQSNQSLTSSAGEIAIADLASTVDIFIRSQEGRANRNCILQLGGEDAGESTSLCYLPVALNGVHAPGVVMRGDGTVTLPLSSMVDRNDEDEQLKSIAEILVELI